MCGCGWIYVLVRQKPTQRCENLKTLEEKVLLTSDGRETSCDVVQSSSSQGYGASACFT